ncbi:MAG: HAD-IC family P-type ATPase, partial [Nocardioides sp.]
PEALERAHGIDVVLLDKTGTVTTGEMTVQRVVVEPDADADEVLRLAGALEHASEHPIARAVARAAAAQLGVLPAVADFENLEGLGVRGTVDGRAVVVGRAAFVAGEGVMSAVVQTALEDAGSVGATAVLVGVDARVVGVLVVADQVKATSAAAVAALRELGATPVLVTGDAERVARAVAVEVGLDEVVADVMPADKLALVRRYQEQGLRVAMVGDGVNDAAALAQADLGLAMGTGTDAAIKASDLTLVRGDLLVVPDAIRLSRRMLATIRGNLVWAFGYNVAAIPLAAAGLLNPMIAGGAMAFSSVFVVLNSLRLRGFRPAAEIPEPATTSA